MQVRIELYDVQRTKWVHNAHSSPLACMALSLNGKLLATASERGTLVRIHATLDGTRLQVCSLAAEPLDKCTDATHTPIQQVSPAIAQKAAWHIVQ